MPSDKRKSDKKISMEITKKLPIRLIPKKEDIKKEYLKKIEEFKKADLDAKQEAKGDAKPDMKLLGKGPPEKDFSKVAYDPNDTGMELSVIKINIEGVDYNFLLGRTNNLYTYDKDNELIGKVDILDDKKLNVYLCEGWRERLKEL